MGRKPQRQHIHSSKAELRTQLLQMQTEVTLTQLQHTEKPFANPTTESRSFTEQQSKSKREITLLTEGIIQAMQHMAGNHLPPPPN